MVSLSLEGADSYDMVWTVVKMFSHLKDLMDMTKCRLYCRFSTSLELADGYDVVLKSDYLF